MAPKLASEKLDPEIDLAPQSSAAHHLKKTTAVVVDDDPLVLSVIPGYFNNVDDIHVTGRFLDAAEALQYVSQEKTEVVISDIHMPNMDGITFLRHLNSLEHRPKFIAMAALDNDATLATVLRHGGLGYVLKSQPPALVVEAVRDAIAGGMLVSPQVAMKLAESRRAPLVERAAFSAIEKSVVQLLLAGLNNKEIAQQLHYSESTVKRILTTLMQRFECPTRVSLVIRLLRP